MAFRYAYRCAQRLHDHGILGLSTVITAASQNSTLLTAPWQVAAAVILWLFRSAVMLHTF